MASEYPDEGLPPNDDEDRPADLPFRSGGASRPAHAEARAEIRDRETYYAELRFAVHCQSRSIPVPRTAKSAQDNRADLTEGTEGESWDEMIARFGDTWT